ncbi:hypothetical protein TWF102_009306 [Orbilia oligospora]|uniref:F-box domain-containing protein n=1 Tax=Orbilia oligospora TaxID=2813651 RepID=A0A7C8NCA5_ORBOL|nr:hypothetical protein TWF706_011844 [Orbilia oligospora]KAF3087809.1 hypothetical protein TWF103_001309 [Orbilia oligospora]KAF3090342.1 hypothetical protein TWF102_009306 [Orbilia oligospora]KAF3119982.1 hypothetical protein TWF703_002935 [Orbilia oligospora]
MPHAIDSIELPKLQFEDLPRELIEEILSLMPTRSLVMISGTSKLIHDIATYILSRRLRHTLHIEGYRLIFECYAADDKFNHPFNHCEYIGTHVGAENSAEATKKFQKVPYFTEDDEGEECNPLANLYSNFTPRSFNIDSQPPSTTVTIDSGDIFTQICASASLVKLSNSEYGGVTSIIPVCESFFRVKRDWLDSAATYEGLQQNNPIAWVGMGENMGLKLNVTGRRIVGPAVSGGVRGRDQEDEAVEYGVEYDGVVIRASYLLEMVEKKQHTSFFQNLKLASEEESVTGGLQETTTVAVF